MKSATGNPEFNKTKERDSSHTAIQFFLAKANRTRLDEILERLGPPVEVSLEKLGATPEEILNHKVSGLERKVEKLEKKILFLEEENKALRQTKKFADSVNNAQVEVCLNENASYEYQRPSSPCSGLQ